MKSLFELYHEHEGKVSDKWSTYLSEYDRLFSAYRDKPVSMLEIGIQNGGSLEIWSKYFQDVQSLVGCDINLDCAKLAFDDPRIRVVIGDANTDVTEREILGHSAHFDLIIDDGSHTSSDIVKSFTRYFRHLSDGGIFVAEDLHCSYWKSFEGGLYYPYSSIAFFKRLTDVVNHEHWGIEKERKQLLRGFSEQFSIEFDELDLADVHAIEFFNSGCVVHKRKAQLNVLGERFIAGQNELVVSGLHSLLGQSLTQSQSSNPWAVMIPAPDEDWERLSNALSERDGQIGNLNQIVIDRDNQIGNLNQIVIDRDNQIGNLNQVVIDRDNQIGNLNQIVIDRDNQIGNLNQVVIDRDNQIGNLNQVVIDRDNQIVNLNQIVIDRDNQIVNLNQIVIDRDNQIVNLNQVVIEIKTSTSWKLTLPLRFIKYQINRARSIAIQLPHSLHESGGVKETISKTYSIFRREGVHGVIRRLRSRLSSGKTDTLNKVSHQHNFQVPQLPPEVKLTNSSNLVRLLETYVGERFRSASSKVTWSSRYVPKATDGVDVSQLPIKTIAFYLPQFHPIPENDAWWGKGFTEWTNVSKAQPQFLGHYQPHLPGELGFYDLRLPGIMHQQVELAKKYGIAAFCFHYYWFGGKRLLELPINNFLADPSLNLDFCFCWANENWSRRWDGLESDILMEQKHSPEDDIAFIEAMVPAFSDPRYIRIHGKPLLIVYRVSLLPDAPATATRWRKRAKEMGFPGLYLVAARSFEITDPRPFGFDAAVEFPPHQVSASEISRNLKIVNPDYCGKIYDYAELAERYGQQSETKFVNFKTVMPSWDNEARKPGAGHTFAGALPETYAKWLTIAAQATLLHSPEERLLFINAWNEWGEGAHLEPDRHYGYAYLHATVSVLRNLVCNDGTVTRVAEINTAYVKRFNIAVILHLYYEDLIDPIFSSYLSPLHADVDLFVTLKKDVSLGALEKIQQLFPNVYILLEENCGRDIRPFIKAYQLVEQKGYQYICKIHSKKSPHRSDGTDWRDYLITSLLSSRDEVMRIISRFTSDDKLGLLAPANSLVDLSIPDIHMDNKKWLDLLLARIGANEQIGRYTFHFPAGSMYWFRTSALLPLLDESVININNFELEAGQRDGTLAHTVERIIGLLLTRQGYTIRELP